MVHKRFIRVPVNARVPGISSRVAGSLENRIRPLTTVPKTIAATTPLCRHLCERARNIIKLPYATRQRQQRQKMMFLMDKQAIVRTAATATRRPQYN